MTNSQSTSGVDKKHLYGVFERTQAWQDDLGRKAAHKALDIPVDDMNIDARKGINGWQLVGLAAVVALGLLGWRMTAPDSPSSAPPSVAPIEASEYEVKFWTEDGTEIDVKEDPAS